MTDRERAIVMAYTGICMLTGDKLQIFHKYVEDIMGRPVWTHEAASDSIADEISAKSKDDFIALCADESNSENLNKWIPVSERLPGENICEAPGPVWKRKVLITGYYKWLSEKEAFISTAFAREVKNNSVYDVNVIAWMPYPEIYKESEE